jgi:hypothetical protein
MLLLGNRWWRVLHLHSSVHLGEISLQPDQKSGRNSRREKETPLVTTVICFSEEILTYAGLLGFLTSLHILGHDPFFVLGPFLSFL